MKTKGFFKMRKSNAIAAVAFFAISIFAFVPIVTGTMWNGINCCSWLLSLLALFIPIYNIAADYSDQKSKR